MKKRKPIAEPQEHAKSNLTDKDLSIIVFSNSDEQTALISKNIASQILRSRSETSLIICGNTRINGKELEDLHTKGRAKVVSTKTEDIVAERSSSSWFMIADATETFDYSKAIACFAANRKTFDNQKVNAGVFHKASGKINRSIGQKVSRFFFNLFAQLTNPSAAHDYTHRYFYFPAGIVDTIFSSRFTTPNEWLALAAYHGYEIHSFPLTQKDGQKDLVSYGRSFSSFFSTRFKWFVSDAWKAPKENQGAWRLAFFAFTFIALFALPVLSFDFGITWDAKRHNEYGYQMLHYFTSLGEDTTCLKENSPIQEFRFYGEQFNVISAALNTYLNPFGEYETRHFLNALYGFIAMLFAALSAKEIGSWRTGVFAFALIFLSPVFFAHSMNNPTDIPFAAGCAVALYYLLKLIKNLPAPKTSYVVMCGVGVGIAVGSRVGGIIWYAYTAMFLGLSWLFVLKQNGWGKSSKLILPYAKILLGVIVVGHIISISVWPFGQQHPLTNWYVALKRSTDSAFFTYNHELFEGVRMYMANVPWYYLPKFIIINTPLFVLTGLALGLLLAFVWRNIFKQAWMPAAVLFVLLFPIVYAEFQSMYYYNGWRHYLFIYPPLIVLSAAGWDALMRLIKNNVANSIIGISIVALMINPVRWMIKNHPNECVYCNELVGGIDGAYSNYETDYYSNSCREAAEWLANHEPSKKVVVAINNEPLTAAYYAQKVNPNMEFRWVREYEEERSMWEYAIITSRTYSKNELQMGAFPPKGTIYTVMADNTPLAAVVKREDWNMPHGYNALDRQQYDSAIYYFTKATEYNPLSEEAFRILGQAYLTIGDTANALKYLKKAIEIYPENYMAYHSIGVVYLSILKDYPKALEYFRIANSYKFNYADSYFYSAMALYQQGDYMGGVNMIETCIKRGGSGIAEIYYNLAIGYYNLNNMKKAEENLMLTLALNNNFTRAYGLLAEVYTKNGKTQEAEYCRQKYIQLGGS